MRPIQISKSLVAAVANGICQSQTPGAGSSTLTLNGSLVTSGVAVMDSQRQVKFDPGAGNFSGAVITLNGTDDNGNVISEALAGGNATPTLSVLNYKTITSITIASGPGAVAVVVGTTGVGASPPVILDRYISPISVQLAYELVSGAQNVDIQYTNDDPFAAAFLTSATIWNGVTGLTGKAANADGQLAFPATAVRMLVNSGTGAGRFLVRQAGGHGVT